MKYAILLKDRRKIDALQIEEYCATSDSVISGIVVYKDFSIFCQRLKVGDSVITNSIVTLGKRFEDIINNVELSAMHRVNFYCIKEQVLIDTGLSQTTDRILNFCLKLYKKVVLFRNKSIQDNLLAAGRPRVAPSHKQVEFETRQAEIMTLNREGKDTSQMAKLLGCSHSLFYHYVKKHPKLSILGR